MSDPHQSQVVATVVAGPQGCGKSIHAQALARHYGCHTVVDDWWLGQPIVAGALHLTQLTVAEATAAVPAGVRVEQFKHPQMLGA